MYCGLLLPIHAGNLNRFGESRKSRLPRRSARVAWDKTAPPWADGAACNVTEPSDCYLAGAVAEESLIEVDFFEDEDFL